MLKAISLFSGAGGCSVGFTETGQYEFLAAFDNNKFAVETYNRNFQPNLAKIEDLSICDYSKIRKNLNIKSGELDIIIGGPPCQGFSSAGSRSQSDIRNLLINNYIEAIKEFSPKWFFIENVEGILTTAKGEYLIKAIKKFTELGYSTILEKVYSQEYGIPQRRKRVIILGTRTGIRLSFPKPMFQMSGTIFRNTKNTLKDAISDLEEKCIPEIDQIPKKESDINLKRIMFLKQGQSMKDLPIELQHESFSKRSSRRVSDGTPTEKRGGAPSGLKRLVYNEPSLTITSASTREFIHPVKDRTLTIRECARIQTFKDTFQFCGSASEKIKQIGNAIPPLLAKIFAEHIFELNKSSKKYYSIGLNYFSITRADAMSPMLRNTYKKLDKLTVGTHEDLFYGIN